MECGQYAFIKTLEDLEDIFRVVRLLNEYSGGLMKLNVICIDSKGNDIGSSFLVDGSSLISISNVKVLEEIKGVHAPTDLIKLTEVSHPCILATLKSRFLLDEIYTQVGPILVALNPFKWIKGLYSEDKMKSYLSGEYNDVSSHPHVFGIARESYISLCEDNKDQSILVSGESGSGKTETTKQCLNYLAFAAGSSGSNITQKNPLSKHSPRVIRKRQNSPQQ